MGFVRENVEFTMDVVDTEVESVAVSDEVSVIDHIWPIRAFLDFGLLVFVLKFD